jgi:hypothetical protein
MKRNWFSSLLLLILITAPALAQTATPSSDPTTTPTIEAVTPTITATLDPTVPQLELYWSERYLLLYNSGTETVDVTELDLRGVQNAFVDGETWFRASFQFLEPRRCVFIYQFDFSGGEELPYMEDALDLLPNIPCENDEAFYIGVALENAVWMSEDGEFTAVYSDVETVTCSNAEGFCTVPLAVELPEDVITLFWTPELLVVFNAGQTAQDLSDLTLTAGENTLTMLDDVQPFLSSLEPGQCAVFYQLEVSPQPRLPEHVACVEVVAAQQIEAVDFVWLAGTGFTAEARGMTTECNTFSRASCVMVLTED